MGYSTSDFLGLGVHSDDATGTAVNTSSVITVADTDDMARHRARASP
ncbi:hypothetical protein MYCOZU1_01152 [Mycobacterium intracellulare subsp. chimaera]|jgi:hypothetical protein|uniref:Uncharacterized protein n=1 Tax=Mycobacterium intracellulare subsp. chimaera TaxID=222805 RepID=A0A220XPW0_MYCIT|nr:hypothetical protein MYCODSM44623_01057 [Mycobacterium intracellulare subsp. chimaera]ASL13469.1 hypothetical protein MYCOZU2_01027 [Mycobacterium intracellulare subsp. chimaera]ASL19603.1 hypothetical protein MYCOZU1_01152 [Mycobacterium intracellulare subsp. chimaera]ETZ33628.1 hypothetical protein L842_0823 [Mycobacterium intracellulare MIN_052511_1280]